MNCSFYKNAANAAWDIMGLANLGRSAAVQPRLNGPVRLKLLYHNELRRTRRGNRLDGLADSPLLDRPSLATSLQRMVPW